MSIKSYRPITPIQRFKTMIDFKDLTPRKAQPRKPRKLTESLKRTGGRNNLGRITSFQMGGGHKRRYRHIDFARTKLNVPGKIASIEYDPNRTTYIALVNYKDGEKQYILAPLGLKVGDSVVAGEGADILPGNCLPVHAIPVGTLLHNIEVTPGKGGRLIRSAGAFGQLMAKEGEYCHVKMPSGELRLIHRNCVASIGQLSNTDHENVTIGKAGRSRWLGRRPHTRAVAMNPIDHPMGGGEGKASGGHPQSPWGTPAKGYKTRSNKRTDAFIVKRRR